MGMKPAGRVTERLNQRVSVLNREPMGMKPAECCQPRSALQAVSVLNREPMGMKLASSWPQVRGKQVSVLNREPMGMKHPSARPRPRPRQCFSAQPRADGDEACWPGH